LESAATLSCQDKSDDEEHFDPIAIIIIMNKTTAIAIMVILFTLIPSVIITSFEKF